MNPLPGGFPWTGKQRQVFSQHHHTIIKKIEALLDLEKKTSPSVSPFFKTFACGSLSSKHILRRQSLLPYLKPALTW